MSWEYLVHSLRDDSESRKRAAASGDVSSSTGRVVHQVTRCFTCPHHARSISRHREFSGCCATLRRENIYWVRDRRNLFGGSAAQDWVGTRLLANLGKVDRVDGAGRNAMKFELDP